MSLDITVQPAHACRSAASHAAHLQLHESRGYVLLLRGARLTDPLSLHEHLHGTKVCTNSVICNDRSIHVTRQ